MVLSYSDDREALLKGVTQPLYENKGIIGLEQFLTRPDDPPGYRYDCCFVVRDEQHFLPREEFCKAMCEFCDVPSWDEPRFLEAPRGMDIAECYKAAGGIKAMYQTELLGGFDPSQDPGEKADINGAVLAVFLHMMDLLHCAYRVFRGTADPGLIFVTVRMQERGLRKLAHYNQYGLELDASSSPKKGNQTMSPVTAGVLTKQELRVTYALYDIRLEPTIGKQVFRRYGAIDDLKNPPAAEGTLFRQIDRVRLLNEYVNWVFDIEALENHGIHADWYALHDDVERERISHWSHLSLNNIVRNCVEDTMDHEAIRSYLGEEYAMYFSWLTMYTRVLSVVAIPGVLVGGLQMVRDYELSFNDPLTKAASVLFSFLLACWMAWMAARWADEEAILGLRWGTMLPSGAQRILVQRAGFTSKHFTRDQVRPWRLIKLVKKRAQNIRWTAVFILVLVSLAVFAVLANGDIHEALLNWVVYGSFSAPADDNSSTATLMTFLPMIVTAVVVKISDELFSHIAEFAVDTENWQYVDDHDDSHVAKRFAFSCLDYFSALLYLGLIKRYVMPDPTANYATDLRQQLFIQWALEAGLNVVEIWTPRLAFWQKTRKFKIKVYGAEREYYLPAHEGTLEEYMEMVTQLGLVTLFSLVLPFIPMFVWSTNQWELLLDCDKLVNSYRRPFPRQSRGIGAWNKILRIMSWVVMNLNLALCVFSTIGRHLPVTRQMTYMLIFSIFGLFVREYLFSRSSGKKEGLNQRVKSLLLKDELITPEHEPAPSPIALHRTIA